MKILTSLIITSSILLSSSLEDSLLSTNFKQIETEKIDFLTVQLKEMKEQYSTRVKSDKDLAIGLSKASKNIQRINNKATQELNNRYRNLKENYKAYKNENEVIVLKNLEIPEVYVKHGIKEKVIVSFKIDEKNNISKIHFEKEPKYTQIKEEIIKAIIKSRYEIIKKEKEETITLYYDFQI